MSSLFPFLLMLRMSFTMWWYRHSRRFLSGTTAMSWKKRRRSLSGGTAPLFRMSISAETHALRMSRCSCRAARGSVVWRSGAPSAAPPAAAEDPWAPTPPLLLLLLPTSKSINKLATASLSAPL